MKRSRAENAENAVPRKDEDISRRGAEAQSRRAKKQKFTIFPPAPSSLGLYVTREPQLPGGVDMVTLWATEPSLVEGKWRKAMPIATWMAYMPDHKWEYGIAMECKLAVVLTSKAEGKSE